MRTIDAHLHTWDLTHGGYAWLGAASAPLQRSFLADEAMNELVAAGVDAAVLVQADDSIADTEYLLGIAARQAWVHGVVGWVQLDDPRRAASQLDQFDGTKLCGLRHLVHNDPRDDFLDLPEVRQSLLAIANRGFAFDVPDAWPRHLDSVTRLAQDMPTLTVVLDHLGKPPRGTDDMAAWETSLRRLAGSPNAVAKVSGLQAPGQPLTAEALRPVLDVALDSFGADRLLFGSDWPMTVPFGGYATALTVIRDLVGDLSMGEQRALWSGTATRVYGGGVA